MGARIVLNLIRRLKAFRIEPYVGIDYRDHEKRFAIKLFKAAEYFFKYCGWVAITTAFSIAAKTTHSKILNFCFALQMIALVMPMYTLILSSQVRLLKSNNWKVNLVGSTIVVGLTSFLAWQMIQFIIAITNVLASSKLP